LVTAQVLAFRVFNAIPTASFGDDLTKQGNPAILMFAAYGDNVTTAHVSSAFIGHRSRLILLSEYLLFTGWVFFCFGGAGNAVMSRSRVLGRRTGALKRS
jgi:hypothetical protein